MRRTISVSLFILIAASACRLDRHRQNPGERTIAANALTARYAQSALSAWNVRGRAAGADCGVLFVETSIVMEDSMVEALHYGAGAYDVYRGGVQQFSRDREFRGVAYKDRSGQVWRFGEVHRDEPLAPCR